MKKIKWENIIAMILGGLYINHSIGLEYENIGFAIAQTLFITITVIAYYHIIKATRKGHTLKAIKEMFLD